MTGSLGSGPEARALLRDRLVAAGHQIDSGLPGIYGRSAAYEAVAMGIIEAARARVEPGADPVRWYFPPLMSRETFERTDYLESFPNLTGVVDVFEGGDAEHAELLATRESGADWAGRLTPSQATLVPATCHNVYRHFTGVLPAPVRLDALGTCFRHEPSADPMRMVTFRIHEEIYLGTEDGALDHRDRWLAITRELMTDLGLVVEVDVANDPFFGRAGRILARGQREDALKFEVLTHVYDDAPTAIASGNAHRTHFGVNFGITLPDGEPAHSSCSGIGVERTANALFARHGMDLGSWPAQVRTLLGV